jgi:hypothetical protein
MKPRLVKAAETLRDQVNANYPDRDKTSDGWIADARHLARGNSDHIPDNEGWVCAVDLDRDLHGKPKPDVMGDLADQLRIAARNGDNRIKYIIFDGRICSRILNFKWRPYKGANAHKAHMHVSFNKKQSKANGSLFNIPMLGGSK